MEQPARSGHGKAPTRSGEQHAEALPPKVEPSPDSPQNGTPPADKWDWIRRFMASDLTSTQKLILHTLAARMDVDGSRCFPPIEDKVDEETGDVIRGLLSMTSLGKSAFHENLKVVKVRGWVAVKSGVRGRASVYRMLVPAEPVSVRQPDLNTVPGGSFRPAPGRLTPAPGRLTPAPGLNTPATGPHQTKDQINDQITSPADYEPEDWWDEETAALAGVAHVVEDLGFSAEQLQRGEVSALVSMTLRVPAESRFDVLNRAGSWGPYRGAADSVFALAVSRIKASHRQVLGTEASAHG